MNGVQLINRCLPQLFGLYVDKVISCLTPVQRLGPLILMGADTVKTVARVPEVADRWIASRRHSKSFLPEALPEYKGGAGTAGKAVSRAIYFSRSLYRRYDARSRGAHQGRLRAALPALSQWGQPDERYNLKFDELKRDRLILGSLHEVVEQVMSYHEEFGAEVMWFMVDWPGNGPALDAGTDRVLRQRGDPANQTADAGVSAALGSSFEDAAAGSTLT